MDNHTSPSSPFFPSSSSTIHVEELEGDFATCTSQMQEDRMSTVDYMIKDLQIKQNRLGACRSKMSRLYLIQCRRTMSENEASSSSSSSPFQGDDDHINHNNNNNNSNISWTCNLCGSHLPYETARADTNLFDCNCITRNTYCIYCLEKMTLYAANNGNWSLQCPWCRSCTTNTTTTTTMTNHDEPFIILRTTNNYCHRSPPLSCKHHH